MPGLSPSSSAIRKEQRFLLFQIAGVAHSELDQHEIVAPSDVKKGCTVAEVRRGANREFW
jgi:hypothetical protein